MTPCVARPPALIAQESRTRPSVRLRVCVSEHHAGRSATVEIRPSRQCVSHAGEAIDAPPSVREQRSGSALFEDTGEGVRLRAAALSSPATRGRYGRIRRSGCCHSALAAMCDVMRRHGPRPARSTPRGARHLRGDHPVRLWRGGANSAEDIMNRFEWSVMPRTPILITCGSPRFRRRPQVIRSAYTSSPRCVCTGKGWLACSRASRASPHVARLPT